LQAGPHTRYAASMSLLDDFVAALQSYADSSGSVYLRQGLGVPGNYVIVRYETVSTGQAYASPGFMEGLATALNEAVGGHVVTSSDIVASFSVRYRRGIVFSWGGPGSLDTLTNGFEGQCVTLFFTNGMTTIAETGNIILSSGVTYVGASDQAITFMYDGSNWREVSRTA